MDLRVNSLLPRPLYSWELPPELSMRAILFIILLYWLTLAPLHAQPLQTWDALPAFDPLHLAGAYAGRRDCPMCSHGYDAGLLLFIPSGTDIAQVNEIIAPVRRLRREIAAARYRVFVIVTGAAPSSALLDAVSVSHAQWYVASLSGPELLAAERDFAQALSETPLAYAFAQRRLLRQYSATELLNPAHGLATDALYAMNLLDWLHPDALDAAADHDTPQGALWFAATRLHASLKLTEATAAPACFLDDAGKPLAYALLFFQSVDNLRLRPRWERSDARGCLQLATTQGRYLITFYALDQTPIERELLRIDPRSMPPVLGQCEGCEAVYDGRPLHLTSQVRLGSTSEPGAPLRLQGRVHAADGTAAAGTQIYAYQTDQTGVYPALHGVGPIALRHGRLRGWAVSDSEGRFSFHTVRPGAYPDNRIAAHIHLHVIEANRCTYYLDDVEFADDPLRAGLAEHPLARGGSGLTHPKLGADGVWEIHRAVYLGRNVPGYERCARSKAHAVVRYRVIGK